LKKKRILLILIALSILFLGVRPQVKSHFDYVADLEYNHTQELYRWVTKQRSLLSQLDRQIAVALTSNDPFHQQQSLLLAQASAEEAYSLLWRGSNLHSMDQSIQRWQIPSICRDISHYLTYLSDQTLEQPLTTNQINTLEEIRNTGQILYFAFTDLSTFIQYPQTGPEGTVIQTNSWQSIRNNSDISSLIDEIGNELRLMDRIGQKDPLYRASFEHNLASANKSSISNSDYPHLDETAHQAFLEALASRIEAHIDGSPKGDSQPSYSKTSTVQNESMVEFSDQEVLYFSSQNTDKQIVFHFHSTSKGGYLYHLDIQQTNSPYKELADVLPVSEKIFEEWLKDHPMNLTLIHESTHSQGNSIQYTYASVEKGVVINPKQVSLSVQLEENGRMTIRIDAFRYYSLYLTPYDLEPRLTPEEALLQIAPYLNTMGSPSLEIKLDDPKLVYRIPVTGIKWVDAVFVNALSGKHEGIDYDYTRPTP